MPIAAPLKQTVVVLSILIAGCFDGNGGNSENEAVPTSLKESCSFITIYGDKMPCYFEQPVDFSEVPISAICSSSYSLNGVTVEFSHDYMGGFAWFSYSSRVTPISGYLHNPNTNDLIYFIDANPNGSFALPWESLSANVDISIYWDFLFYNGVEWNPRDGEQEFYLSGGEVFAITRWIIEGKTLFSGPEEGGYLTPDGTQSWVDESGDETVIHSFKTFFSSRELPTFNPDSCNSLR